MNRETARVVRFRPRVPRLSVRERFHVVVIGGGFSGTAFVSQLVRHADSRFRITLLNADERLGRGLAYASINEIHLLNARARDMSLYADEPDDFVLWLKQHGLQNSGGDFVSRKRFGDYLEDSLVETSLFAAQTDVPFTAMTGKRVVDLMAGGRGFVVALEDASTLQCDAVVLATGHPPPRDLLSPWLPEGHERWIRDPWHNSLDADKNDRILMVGSGLTMVDKVLELDAQRHEGPIHVLSPRGLLPRAHRRRAEPLPAELRESLVRALSRATTPRQMLRATRRAIAAAESRGLSWHAVIDSMRPLVPDMWSAMPLVARRRFLNHLRPWWDVHRHRMAPVSSVTIAAMMRRGRLDIRAGEVCYAGSDGSRLLIAQSLRGEIGTCFERYDWVVNCTGHDGGGSDRPLDRQLIRRGLVAEDCLGLGYTTTDDGEAMTVDGPVRNLYLLGQARRPQEWESTAVPELRKQAVKIATALIARVNNETGAVDHRLSPSNVRNGVNNSRSRMSDRQGVRSPDYHQSLKP